ncbi:MAG: putative Ig domain-containing protein [Bacteroidota bacterium]
MKHSYAGFITRPSMFKVLFLCLLGLSHFSYAQQTARPKGTTACNYGYYEYLPAGYSTQTKLPLVIFFHGKVEKGNGTTDLAKVLVHGPPKMAQAGTQFGFILISPQHPDAWWTADNIAHLIQYAKATYKVDAERVYVTGLSAGGTGTWIAGQDLTSQIAAIVPICGQSLSYEHIPDPKPVAKPANMVGLPIWAFHNEGDPFLSPNISRDIIESIQANGGGPLLTIYPKLGHGHDAWTETYNDNRMWNWLLAQKKPLAGAPNQPPVMVGISNQTASVGVVKTTDILATDANNNPLTFTYTTLPAGVTFGKIRNLQGMIISGAGKLTVSATAVKGSYPITFTVNDGNGGTDSKSFTLTVTNAPVLSAIGNKTVQVGTNFTVSATDADAEALTFSLSGQPAGVTLTNNGNNTATIAVSSTATAGTYANVKVTVKDINGIIDDEMFTLTITSNQPPVLAAIGQKSATVGTVATFNVSATDPNSDPVTFSLSGQPAGVTIANNANNTATITVAASTAAGSYATLTVTASDGKGGQDTETFTLVVSPPTRYEAETSYTKATDVDGDVGSMGCPVGILSNDRGISIYDTGDKIILTFSVAQAGTYQLYVRARSGDVNGSSNYFPPNAGYNLRIDNAANPLTGVTGTQVSALTNCLGNSYWGTLVLPLLNLTAGQHTLSIESTRNWAAVDYLEVARTSTARLSALAEENSLERNVAYPNPFQSEVHVLLSSDEKQAARVSWQLVDLSGKVQLSATEVLTPEQVVLKITKLSKLAPGSYLLHLQTAQQRRVIRLLK